MKTLRHHHHNENTIYNNGEHLFYSSNKAHCESQLKANVMAELLEDDLSNNEFEEKEDDNHHNVFNLNSHKLGRPYVLNSRRQSICLSQENLVNTMLSSSELNETSNFLIKSKISNYNANYNNNNNKQYEANNHLFDKEKVHAAAEDNRKNVIYKHNSTTKQMNANGFSDNARKGITTTTTATTDSYINSKQYEKSVDHKRSYNKSNLDQNFAFNSQINYLANSSSNNSIITTSSSSDEEEEEDDDDDDNDNNDNNSGEKPGSNAKHINDVDEEDNDFVALFKQVALKHNLEPNDEPIESESKADNILASKISFKTLKYLHKLLRLYKLDHYMSDLCEAGYCTTISLEKLKPHDLERLHVSPYDKKKFLKLQMFIKQVMNSISTDQNEAKPSQMKMRSRGADTAKLPSQLQSQTSCSSKMSLSKSKSFMSNHHLAPTWQESTSNNSIISKSTAKSNKSLKPSSVKPIQANPLVNANKPASQRTKSSEPAVLSKQLTFDSNTETLFGSNSNVFKSSGSLAVSKSMSDVPAVNHPNLFKPNNNQQENNCFGPKLSQAASTEYGSKNVQLIEANSYNYGVPLLQQQHKKQQQAALLKKKRTAAASQRSNQASGESCLPSIVTADIYVYARKRPKLSCEAKFNDVVVVNSAGESMGNKTAPSICITEMKSALDGSPILRKNEFLFDKTFDSTLSNEDLYKTSIMPFINVPFENRTDFTCICFGQTGSGKTHTLFGNKQQDGLCALTAQALFTNNERLYCGFYEIYNGQLYDLLNKKNKLVLREDSNGQVNVVGLIELEIKSLVQLRKTIETAQANRHIGCTSFNKASSRSHAVVQLLIPNLAPARSKQIANPSASNVASVKSKVNSGLNNASTTRSQRVLFIDLAGSERGIDAQNNRNDNRKEGAEINQSLLALKECIRCIDQSCSHAPFRQSKLTRVLRDCFIGCGRTVLIATVSPTDDCVSCSLNTLQYANRVRQMTLRNKNRNEKMLSNPGTKAATQTESNQQQEDMKPTGITSGLSKSTSAKVISEKRPSSNLPRQDRSSSRTTSIKSKPSTKPACPNVPALDLKQLNPARSNEVLKHKPGIASTLFHPSKINMSSTPIKTNTKKRVVVPTEDMSSTPIKHSSQTHLNLNMNKQVAEELLFEHDTPIKGHKIKQMNEVNAQCVVPNRYVARVNVPDYSNETGLNNKIYAPSSSVESHNKNHLVINIDKNQADLDVNKNKNEDDESGVETDELNKSNELKQQAEQLEYATMKSVQRDMLFGKDSTSREYQFENNFLKSTFSSRTKLISDANRSRLERSLSSSVVATKAAVCKSKPSSARVADSGSSGQADDSLAKLRKKQKQMLESKKYLHNDSVSDQDVTLKLNEVKSVEDSTGTSSSKKQLRNYVQNLELKLKHLRSEMNDNSLLSFDADKAAKQNPKRSNKLKHVFKAADSNSCSSDSSDSLKEISISQKSNSNKFYSNKNVAMLQEFLQRRNHLEKQQQKFEKNNETKKFNSIMFSDEHERLYLENHKQTEANQKILHSTKNDFFSPTTELNFLTNSSQMLSETEEDNNEITLNNRNNVSDPLQRSLHKGSEFFHFKTQTQKPRSEEQDKFKIYEFSPILNSADKNNLSIEAEISNINLQKLTPRSHNLLNPKPIRLNVSSSLDSFKVSNKHDEDMTGDNLLNASSGSNKSNKRGDLIDSRETLAPSNIKMSSSKIWNQSTPSSKSIIPEITKITVAYPAESKDADSLQDSIKIQKKIKSKDFLVEAHENQLTDITETCKKEMNLLSCLKDSQVDYDEYLNRLEEMLSKKAHSIRDLQFQITQLKTLHNDNQPQKTNS